MFTSTTFTICTYPGCSTMLANFKGQKYCSFHEKILFEVATRQGKKDPALPAPQQPVSQPILPIHVNPQTATPNTDSPASHPVRRGHRKLLEVQKRKFARKAKETSASEKPETKKETEP